MSIQRYDLVFDGDQLFGSEYNIEKVKDGDYVLYSKYMANIAAMRKREKKIMSTWVDMRDAWVAARAIAKEVTWKATRTATSAADSIRNEVIAKRDAVMDAALDMCVAKEAEIQADEPAFKIGDHVEVVGPFGKGSNLNVMVGLCGEIVGIDYRCVRVGLENGVWDFPATNLRYAKAEFVESGKFTLEEIETAFFNHNHGGDEGGEGEYLHRKNTWKSFCRFLDLRIEPSLEKESHTPKGTT